MNIKLDIAFWKESKDLFRRFHEQVKIIQDVFTEIANHFPQEKLKQYFVQAKSCKVSKGNQLGFLPYQVLDIVRDFDPLTGFNIRLLNWWGNGFYIFLTYGSQIKQQYKNAWISKFDDFHISFTETPYDYPQVEKNSLILNEKNITLAINSSNQLQIWKKLDISEDPGTTSKMICQLLTDILEVHG
ncbi:hypothetical protein [Cecembia calidifontis]|uniref:Uncharacterized protein n=1 Tax=Cecembia calidifontis TaxID=1187080 RepID=A0A4Q7P8B7_9BACT|nr:hypothetical protein [Cecembia calidifontis]RZS96354.1 hypothetical protein BC751_1925 [Cecembia calidifontis]